LLYTDRLFVDGSRPTTRSIDEDERNRILENIRQAFMFKGDELEVI